MIHLDISIIINCIGSYFHVPALSSSFNPIHTLSRLEDRES